MKTSFPTRLHTSLLLLAFLTPITARPAAGFKKVISIGDSMPDRPGKVALVRAGEFDRAPGSDQFLVLLNEASADFLAPAFAALYLEDSNHNLKRVVDTETPVPGGALLANIPSFTVYGGKVYFTANLARTLCRVDTPGGPVTVIAKQGDTVDQTNRFEAFIGGLSAYAGGLVFDANAMRPRDYRDSDGRGAALSESNGFVSAKEKSRAIP